MVWRKKLDPVLKEHFEEVILRTHREWEAYKSAKKPSNAQLWTAIAVLTKRISDLELKLKKLEKPKKDNKKLKTTLKKL